MTEWEPATDAEVAMRNALRTDDQESYFRILAGVDLLLPVSADALAGLEPLGWGTWSTGGRTHVLAFTSPSALQACLSDYTGSARRVPYSELAETWPNLEWWLAVNPGLPIEGYLPAWFVAQLSRGDLRLPKRGPARQGAGGTGRLKDLQAAAMAANAAATQGYASPASGGPVSGSSVPGGGHVPGAPVSGGPVPAGHGATVSNGHSATASSGQGAPVPGGAGAVAASAMGYGPGQQPAGSAPGQPGSAPGQPGSTLGQSGSAPGQSGSAPGQSGSAPGQSGSAPGQPGSVPAAPGSAPGGPVGPGGLPVRTPGAVLPSGLPSRVPSTPPGMGGVGDSSSFSGFTTGGGRAPQQEPSGTASSPAAFAGGSVRPATPPSAIPSGSALDALASRSGTTAPPAGGSALDALGSRSGGPAGVSGASASGLAGGGAPAAGPAAGGPAQAPPAGPASVDDNSRDGGSAGNEVGSDDALPPLQRPDGPLPTRTPMAQTPPLPSHLTAAEQAEASALADAGPQLPRRQVTPPSERPSSMAAAAQALAARGEAGATPSAPSDGASGDAPTSIDLAADQAARTAGAGPATRGSVADQAMRQAPAAQAKPSIAPPVIPGAGGANRSSTSAVPAPATRPSVPPTAPSQPVDRRPAGPASAAGLAGPAGESGPAAPTGGPASPSGPATGSPASPSGPATGPSAPPSGSDRTQPAENHAGGGLPRRSPAPIVDRPDTGQDAGTDQDADTGQNAGTGQDADSGRSAPATRYEQAGLEATARIDLGGQAGGWPQQPGGPAADEDDFIPANEVERDLYQATIDRSTDSFLSTLLLATVLVPVAAQSRPGSSPGESGFAFRTEDVEGERYLVVFTSRDRLGEYYVEPARTVAVRFVELIRNWPDPAWSFAVNPGSAVGARYPGPQVIALANWAIEAGLGGEPVEAPADGPKALPQRAHETDVRPTMMQKTVPVEQIDFYLERGYDRIAGFVHRAAEVEHIRVPGELYAALGLLYDGSPYQGDAKEAYVLRWPAYRPSLYRIPYGGQNEQALRAMDGWVIERAPFRGNGFAPGEGNDVIAEFKVDSVRLPHGAQLWRLDGDGAERIVAVFDADAPMWRKVGEADA